MEENPVLKGTKAWIALAGAVATGLLGVVSDDSVLGQVATAVAAVATAVATYSVKNKKKYPNSRI